MGRNSRCPITVEDCETVSLKKLREWGYLKPNQWRVGRMSFSRRGTETGSIDFQVDTTTKNEYLQLSYQFAARETDINYKIPLVRVPTNIGNGYRYYFVCPHTQKRCINLYRPPQEDCFLHRSAFPYLIYEKQTESKRYQELDKSPLGLQFKLEKLEEGILWNKPKYAKLYYRGKPTPRMRRYLKVKKLLENERVK